MRSRFFLFLLLPLLYVSCDADPWRQVAPANLGFTVQMPGKPLEEKEFEQRDDEKLLTYTLKLEQEIVTFVAGYNEFGKAESLAPTKAALDAFRDGMQQVAGKKIGEREIKLQGYAGRALTLKDKDGLIYRSRFFFANRRLYYVLASAFETDTKQATPTIEKFLGSLQLSPLPLPPASEWKKFSSETGHFSVLFPGVPKQKVKDRDLSQPPVFSFVGYDENAAFLVTYLDYKGPSPQPDAQEGLSQFQTGFLKGIKNATLLSVKNITRNQYPGRELRLKDADDVVHHIQFIAAKQRMFTLDVVVASERESEAAAASQKFFDSFEFEAVESAPQKTKPKGPKDS